MGETDERAGSRLDVAVSGTMRVQIIRALAQVSHGDFGPTQASEDDS